MPNDIEPRRGSHFAPRTSAQSEQHIDRPAGTRFRGEPQHEHAESASRARVSADADAVRDDAHRFAPTSHNRTYHAGTYSAYDDDHRGHRHHRHRHRHRGRIIAAVVAAVLVVLLGAAGVCGALLYRDAQGMLATTQTVLDDASTLSDAVLDGDGETASATSDRIVGAVSTMHSTVDGFTWQAASLLPVVGEDIRSARTMVSALDALCQEALAPTVEQVGGIKLSDIMSDGAINVDLITSLGSTLQAVAPVISENAEVINALPAAHIGKLNDAIDKVKGIVGTADSAVQGLNEIMPYLPQMLGADGQTRNYLLMAQTNSEIHATGGHPGAVGIISITDGVLEKGDFVPPMSVMESYDSPVYANEEEIALFNNIGKVPTSSNCTPDFSRAGYIFGEMWKDQVGDDIDGVIAVDPLFLQALMKHVGGFTASNGIQVSGDNVARLLLHDIYLDVPIEETDDFFSEVASTSFELVLGKLGSIGVTDLLETLQSAIENRHFQVFLYNEDEEAVMVKLGCAGVLNSDEAAPEVGVFTEDATASKISWYLSVNTAIDEGVRNADGTTTYHVTSTFKNNLTDEEAESVVDYVTGYNADKRNRADMLGFAFIVSPAGGTISNMTCAKSSGEQMGVNEKTYEGHQVFTNVYQLLAGEYVTYSYDVTVSAAAEKPLGVDTTPLAQDIAGWQ